MREIGTHAAKRDHLKNTKTFTQDLIKWLLNLNQGKFRAEMSRKTRFVRVFCSKLFNQNLLFVETNCESVSSCLQSGEWVSARAGPNIVGNFSGTFRELFYFIFLDFCVMVLLIGKLKLGCLSPNTRFSELKVTLSGKTQGLIKPDPFWKFFKNLLLKIKLFTKIFF